MWTAGDNDRAPLSLQADLGRVANLPELTLESLRLISRSLDTDTRDELFGLGSDANSNSLKLEPLQIQLGLPKPLTELQQLFFTDFVHVWFYWFDDADFWNYYCHVFQAFTRGFLCLAAWDLEVSHTSEVDFPASPFLIPEGKYPPETLYWFHGFLILLEESVESPRMLQRGILRAREYLDSSGHTSHKAHLIIITPQHVVLVELTGNVAAHTAAFPLLVNLSASQCSPGFRVLSSVLSSECWKKQNAKNEKWSVSIPSEVLLALLHASEPRDAVAFAQASSTVKKWYYASVSQFRNLGVQAWNLSIPCCGKRTGLDESGIYCSTCHTWQHQKCVGLQSLPSDTPYICSQCLSEDKNSREFTSGAIETFSGRRDGRVCHVIVDGSPKLMRLRVSRPDLVDFNVRFNGTFSGLAYSFEDV